MHLLSMLTLADGHGHLETISFKQMVSRCPCPNDRTGTCNGHIETKRGVGVDRGTMTLTIDFPRVVLAPNARIGLWTQGRVVIGVVVQLH